MTHKQKAIDLKKSYTSSSLLKLITYVLIVVHLGMGSISLAYLFVENNHHLIEYCNSFENQSVLDELEKEVDDKFKIAFIEEKKSLNDYFNLPLVSDASPNNECSDICTPPPKQS